MDGLHGEGVNQFEQKLLPHADAAYNLAHWLTKNEQDAKDVVQEAFLRAFQFFDSFRGSDAKPWLLKIVRNTCYTWLHKNRSRHVAVVFDEEIHSAQDDLHDTEILMSQSADKETIRKALESLPPEYREALILRELEGLSYKEMSEIVEVPVGTVMSRISRGRFKLREL